MGIFTRFKDIINSNINAMLDKAEDPEKMIKLMIHEMEDTLIDLKSSCAAVIASRKKIDRKLAEIRDKKDLWAKRSQLAVLKGRDNLAREALIEKRRFSKVVDALTGELDEHSGLIQQYHVDIGELEDKLNKAKEKKRVLVHRHKRASGKIRAHMEIKRSSNSDTMARFDKLESRIEQMEAEAELVNIDRGNSLDDEFDTISTDEEIENELAKLKAAQYSTDSNEKDD